MSKDIALDPVFADVLAGRANGRAAGEQTTAEAIITAAEKLFVEQGYHATRVSEVARLADVSIGSIYVHYENKEGLYGALIERALDIQALYVDAVLDSEEIPDIEKVIALGEAYLQFFREHPDHFQMLMLPAESIPEEAARSPLARQIALRGAAQRAKLAQAIANCVAAGVMRDDVDPERAANFWWAAWNGVIGLSTRSDDLAIDEQEMERIVVTGRLMIAEGLASSAMRDADGRLVEPIRTRLETLKDAPVPAAPAGS
ncbi:MAG: TetR/AcrR family transcriptional regulator [Thermoleophilaceae bacterium]|nr:TetR/AcrR family transcriptional regulator [Thermoleophilaceae bacterium]